MEHESDRDTYSNWHTWKVSKSLVSGLEDLEIGEQAKTI